MRDEIVANRDANGCVCGFQVADHGFRIPWEAKPTVHNTVLYDWAPAAQKLFRNRRDGKSYHVGGMYIEFDNSGSPVNPTPTIARSGGLSYYNSVAAPRDYLRVAISATEEENTDDALYGSANMAKFWAQTAGTTGVNGLQFSDAANSIVYGGALVAFLDADDAAQDLVLARFYFDAANQLEKLVGSQIGLLWRWTFL